MYWSGKNELSLGFIMWLTSHVEDVVIVLTFSQEHTGGRSPDSKPDADGRRWESASVRKELQPNELLRYGSYERGPIATVHSQNDGETYFPSFMLEKLREESSQNGGQSSRADKVTDMVQLGGEWEQLEHGTTGDGGESNYANEDDGIFFGRPMVDGIGREVVEIDGGSQAPEEVAPEQSMEGRTTQQAGLEDLQDGPMTTLPGHIMAVAGFVLVAHADAAEADVQAEAGKGQGQALPSEGSFQMVSRYGEDHHADGHAADGQARCDVTLFVEVWIQNQDGWGQG